MPARAFLLQEKVRRSTRVRTVSDGWKKPASAAEYNADDVIRRFVEEAAHSQL